MPPALLPKEGGRRDEEDKSKRRQKERGHTSAFLVYLKGMAVNCAWCHQEIAGERHTISVYGRGALIICGKCADKFGKIYEDEDEDTEP